MVIIATAAISAALYGSYQGGKKAVVSTKEKLTRRKVKVEREDERKLAKRHRELERTETETLSIKERMAKYKNERGF